MYMYVYAWSSHTAEYVCIKRVKCCLCQSFSWWAEQGRKWIFPCPRSRFRIWSRETGSAVLSRVSLLISILRLNLVLTYGILPSSAAACVCFFFPFVLDIKFVGRTSRGHTGGRSHRIFHPPSFCGACFIFSREKDSAIRFPRRPWSRILCTNDLIVLHSLGIYIYIYIYITRIIPFTGIELTFQRVRRLRGYLWATGAASICLF